MKRVLQNLISRTPYRLVNQSRERGRDWVQDVKEMSVANPLRLAFDVGANTGQTTLRLCSAFPDAEVHAFEPVRETFQHLCASTKHIPQVRRHQCALGRTQGQAIIHLHENSEMNSLRSNLPPIEGEIGISTGTDQAIDINTVDNVAAELGLSSIDLLKTDTEGFDAEVMAGADNLLSNRAIRFVFSEVGTRSSDRRHTPLIDLLGVMAGHGYDLYALYDLPPKGWLEAAEFCNALFVAPTVTRFLKP